MGMALVERGSTFRRGDKLISIRRDKPRHKRLKEEVEKRDMDLINRPYHHSELTWHHEKLTEHLSALVHDVHSIDD